jgi:catechol 2,3-dioxygenase-like lactoylglutathione lyase family enzyme
VTAPELDHVQIAAPPGCEPAARHFFGDLLGLEELPKPAPLSARGGCWFALGDRQLHVGVDPDFAPAHKAHIAVRVGAAELDDLAARLEASGAPIAWDTALPAERRFYSADPWGNRIEFLTAIK